MLKTNPQYGPASKPVAAEVSAPIDSGKAAKAADPFSAVRPGDEQSHRESARRRAHRLRMKDFFSRAKSVS